MLHTSQTSWDVVHDYNNTIHKYSVINKSSKLCHYPCLISSNSYTSITIINCSMTLSFHWGKTLTHTKNGVLHQVLYEAASLQLHCECY